MTGLPVTNFELPVGSALGSRRPTKKLLSARRSLPTKATDHAIYRQSNKRLYLRLFNSAMLE